MQKLKITQKNIFTTDTLFEKSYAKFIRNTLSVKLEVFYNTRNTVLRKQAFYGIIKVYHYVLVCLVPF